MSELEVVHFGADSLVRKSEGCCIRRLFHLWTEEALMPWSYRTFLYIWFFQSSFSSDSELTSLLFLFQANQRESDVTENQIPTVPTEGNISAYIGLAVLVYLCSRISRRTRPGCPSSWKPAPPPYLGKIYQSFFSKSALMEAFKSFLSKYWLFGVARYKRFSVHVQMTILFILGGLLPWWFGAHF